jgi:hydrogenase maturation protein HypF
LEIRGCKIHITGIVQGVGFRPFVYGLAQQQGLKGWVRNTSAGVDIEVDGSRERLSTFLHALYNDAPPLARIDEIAFDYQDPCGYTQFEITHSAPIPGAFQPISPDVSICPDCLSELFDPADRRYRYPFINCTNCGPRFTIIEDIPYDRPLTTMAPFEMCIDCAAEYQNPIDRRFHAQPVACPVCGPHVWFEEKPPGNEPVTEDDAIQLSRKKLMEVKILAVKGLGGFHLACDATNKDAVVTLRERKLRVDKPFALMMPDLKTVERYAETTTEERILLTSRERPIVILKRRNESSLAKAIAPGQDTIGVMLPYTPLHYLLLEPASGFPEALVMTSGNLSEEPIVTDNKEAHQRLSILADGFLLHNRGIRTRCDDSVVRVFPVIKDPTGREKHQNPIYPMRRARGYAPFPVQLPWKVPTIIAGGGELKNAVCFTRERYAILSHHIGDMENYETLKAFEDCVAHYEQLFRLKPEALAYDLHPNYLASRYMLDRSQAEGLPAIGVQHHHAHIAAAMAEHGLESDQKVIGVSFDGTGYGDDGAIWGGEFLIAGYTEYKRPLHLAYVPLPGGDKAIKEPWRMALAWLYQLGIPWQESLPPVHYVRQKGESDIDPLEILRYQLVSGVNCPMTSSMGRLFDAVSSLIGIRHIINYEAQAAIELEALVDGSESAAYSMDIKRDVIDPAPMFIEIIKDLQKKTPVPIIAGRFHNGVAQMVSRATRQLRQLTGINKVVLSGGVWQNMTLLATTISFLSGDDFQVYIHRQVPANDGGLALGQAAVAARRMMSGS